ncbi:twin-arginine translocase subunit TatC [Oceanicoccus sp. KOV_DT_Chl]|uniref:twin-arginine translocase subunit TatC n=1 Tax=Oceanicoccus sp. KOV_DT_Chl TaxID=1904639 RepID=UPI00190E5EBE|nr:twin-arginine translocase subunit TatC [Oceanicoccus sp. KOV_DT_Chl]
MNIDSELTSNNNDNDMKHNNPVNNTAPLLTHLVELRKRLLLCFVFFAIVFGAAYLFAQDIYAFLLRPLLEVFGENQHRRMIFTGLHEAFFTYLKLSFFTAFFFTAPFFLNQIWKFLAPGLYNHEQKSLQIFFWLTPILFVLGASLAYFVVFPLAWQFFLGFETLAGDSAMAVELEPRVSEYLSLVIQLILAFGLSFELPVALILLAKTGLIDAQFLTEKRRYAIVITFAVAALITPPDLISQIALGMPVLILYEVAILLIRIMEKKQPKISVKP